MAIDSLRPTTGGASAAGSASTARLLPASAPELEVRGDTGAPAQAPAAVPLRSNALRSDASGPSGDVQDQAARAQQALDYLERVAGQLESLKGELTARLSGSRAGARAPLEAQARQLASTLNARKTSAGGGVDANLHFNGKPALQRFRIRGLDLDTLQHGGPQTLAFSVGGNGGPQLAASIEPGQSKQEIAAAIDRALAPMGVRAGIDGQGELVFATPEANWPGVRDSIAVSGRGRVAADEVAPALAPQQWPAGGNSDALRQSLREVVQALERVRRSQSAAASALSAASSAVAQAGTPPPDAEVAAQAFASTASRPDYESLLALTSALVGVSRERVLALLGLP